MTKQLKNTLSSRQRLQEGNDVFRALVAEEASVIVKDGEMPDVGPDTSLADTPAPALEQAVVESGNIDSMLALFESDTMFDSDMETRLEVGEDIVDDFDHYPATDLTNNTDFDTEVDIIDNTCVDMVNDFTPTNKLGQEVDYADDIDAPPPIGTLSEDIDRQMMLFEEVSDLEENLHVDPPRTPASALIDGDAGDTEGTMKDAITHEESDFFNSHLLESDKSEYDLDIEYLPIEDGIRATNSVLDGDLFNEEEELVDLGSDAAADELDESDIENAGSDFVW